MKVSLLIECLQKVYKELGYNPNYNIKEVAETTRTLLPDLDREYQNQVIAAFIGFAIGKETGYEEGFRDAINHIFRHTPEE